MRVVESLDGVPAALAGDVVIVEDSGSPESNRAIAAWLVMQICIDAIDARMYRSSVVNSGGNEDERGPAELLPEVDTPG